MKCWVGWLKIAGRNNNLRYAFDTTLMAGSEVELKRLLMKVKEESEKPGLKLNIQKMKIRASGAITSWKIDGKTVETVSDFIFLGSKMNANCDCSHKTKTLAPWKSSYDKPRQHLWTEFLLSSVRLRPTDILLWFDSLFPFIYRLHPLYSSSTVRLSIHLQKDILVASNLGQQWIKLLQTLMCRFLCRNMFSNQMAKYKGTYLLNHIVRLCSAL